MVKRWNAEDEKLHHAKVWGNECWMVNHEEYCAKTLFLKRNHRCSTHYHKKKHETFIIIEGKCLMEVEDEAFIMEKGDIVEVDRGMLHRFTGIEDTIILEVSTQHFEDDSFRNNKSKKLSWKERRWLKKFVKRLATSVKS